MDKYEETRHKYYENNKKKILQRQKKYRNDPKNRKKIQIRQKRYESHRKDYYKNNLNKIVIQIKMKRVEIKIWLLTKIGKKCKCCGIKEWWNLTFDHIKPLGSKKKPYYASLLWKLKNNPDLRKDFQILCYGCNASKSTNIKCGLNHSNR